MNSKILLGLNTEQRRAVTFGVGNNFHILPRPLLILAGAGTGKTRTLAHRAAYLVANGVSPSRILLLVFGRDAALQMRERTEAILREAGLESSGGLDWAGTFHGVGARLLREYASDVGLRSNFTILDRSDAQEMMRRAEHALPKRIRKRLPKLAICLRIYSGTVDHCCQLGAILAQQFPDLVDQRRELRKLFTMYRRAKLASNVVDFEDLLLLWLRLLRDKKIGSKIRSRFDHILVDEFQDTDRLQSEVLHAMKPDGRGLTAVGDDAQSIYGFRGADVRMIRKFASNFECVTEVIRLEQNYRSSQPILDLCNAVMAGAADDLGKTLWTKRKAKRKPKLQRFLDGNAQAQHVVSEIEKAKKRGVPLRQQAVLFRVADHSAELEAELSRRGIPFVKRGGPKFFDQRPIKDLLSVLKWLENPQDLISAIRILDLLPGVGPAGANAIFEKLAGRLTPKRLKQIAVPRSAQTAWVELGVLLTQRKSLRWPKDLNSAYRWLSKLSGNRSETSDFATLKEVASQFRSRRKFLTGSALDAADLSRCEDDSDGVILSTVHSAKGREWSHVKILSAVDGHFPSMHAKDGDAIEEERRVFYVAISRAKHSLEVLVPARILAGDKVGRAQRSYVSLKATPFVAISNVLGCLHMIKCRWSGSWFS